MRRTRAILQISLVIFIVAFLWHAPLRAEDDEAPATPETTAHDYISGKEQRFEMKVHVWGEVRKPGLYEVTDDTDLIELISESGGPTEYADLSKVALSRMNHGGREIQKINILKALKHNGSGVSAPVLKPGDTVMVPRNKTYTWRTLIRTCSEIALIVSTYILIHDRVR